MTRVIIAPMIEMGNHMKRSEAGLEHRFRTARRSRRRLRLGALAAAFALVLSAFVASPAAATDYPSWDDLQKAKANTAAAADAVANIRALIAQLQDNVVATQAESVKRANELQEAQDRYDDAVRRADAIQAQADESKAKADAAAKQAGQLAAQLYRTGGTDLSANLVFDAKSGAKGTDKLLSKLGSMSKLVQRNSDVYAAANAAANTASLLGKQAKIAQDEREKLRIAAEQALDAAVAAQKAAEQALAESQAQSIVLDQQLKFMQDTQAQVAVDYQKGVEERARLAAEAAARAAAAAAASGGGPGAGLSGGWISDQGWAVPAGGRITDGYGPRPVICSGGACSGNFHYGADIGAGCGAPIYAANGGTVVYAGRNGTYGNWVQVDHGGGIRTGYAHIRDGGIFVRVGQHVDVGQNIASVGMTGAATGCHLHFEVFQNGTRINPFTFMANVGAPLG
ncbi:M23 family metallopeptidase [Rathayibacter sp. YIM 133350]|uniref:M23 family metallopeptidase n=1 Tax=Rathayibacter sp. YIM 133350 TaxID=3131992 RepID=UPI00307DBF26